MSGSPPARSVPDDDPLRRPVWAGTADKPFGAFTLADVEGRAAELAATAGWGPTARVAGVARGWAELARVMTATGAATVGELGRERAEEFARRLWVVPPAGSLL